MKLVDKHTHFMRCPYCSKYMDQQLRRTESFIVPGMVANSNASGLEYLCPNVKCWANAIPYTTFGAILKNEINHQGSHNTTPERGGRGVVSIDSVSIATSAIIEEFFRNTYNKTHDRA